MALVSIRGEFDSLNFYKISREVNFSPSSHHNHEELYEEVQTIIESGELDSIISPIEIQLINLDSLEVDVDGETLESREFTLKNRELFELIDIDNEEEGEIYLMRHHRGDGEIIYDIEDSFRVEDLNLDYIDCSESFDQFDILRESYLESFCDMGLIDTISYQGEKLEFEEFIFEPQLVKDELYIVKRDEISGLNVLEKLETGDGRIFGTDFSLDEDF